MPESPEPIAVVHVCNARRAVYGAVQSLTFLASAQRIAGKRVEFITSTGTEFGAAVLRGGYAAQDVKFRTKIDPFAVAKLAAIYRRGGYDIVHTHLSTSSLNGCLAARLAKIPCLATVHGLSGKLSFVFANHLIGVSGEVRNHLAAQGVPESRISVVHNGLPMDVRRPSKATARAELGLPPEGPVIGTVSRVTAMKGIEDAIRAFAKVANQFPTSRYVVVGDGDRLEACKQLARELDLSERVTFLGYRRDIENCLAAMDLFVFPSHKEAMGMALVEAMRSELPVVAYRTGGIPEVVDDHCGRLVAHKDVDALAQATSSLLSDPVQMAQFGMAGRDRAIAEFSDQSMESATEQVYREVIRRHPGPR